MKLQLTSIALAVAFAFAAAAQAQTTGTGTPKRDTATEQRAGASDRSARNAEEERIEEQAKADRKKCDAMKGNAKDVCVAEAKGKEKVAKAELDAKYAGGDKTRAERKVQEARANAAYDVAKEKCDERKGEAKDACVKQARVERDKARGKAERTADARQEQKRDADRAATGGTAPERPKPGQPKKAN